MGRAAGGLAERRAGHRGPHRHGRLAGRPRQDLAGAIQLLEQGWRFPKRPKVHHLRRAYALADLYERAGDVGRARELFGRIRAADPSFADVRRTV